MFRDVDIIGVDEESETEERFPEEEEEFDSDIDDEDIDDIDPGMWEVETRELETRELETRELETRSVDNFESRIVNRLQEMEQTRAKLLHYGEQYDVLPHVRCYQCGKVIGDLWEPYLEYSQERYYKPENIVELLPLNEDRKNYLLEAIGTPDFPALLVEFDVKSDYDVLRNQRKYTNEEIFNKLGGRLLLTEDQHQELTGALSQPKKFQKLLENYALVEEYEEIVRIRVVNEIFEKPLLSVDQLNELSKFTKKNNKFQSLLRNYDVEGEFIITLKDKFSVLNDMLEEGLITNEQFEELYERLIDSREDFPGLISKFKLKRAFDGFINKIIIDKFIGSKHLTQVQTRNLLSLKNNPEQFRELLKRYNIATVYEDIVSEKGYMSNEDILERLGGKLLRPCCRLNLLSPIHVPIQQEAFKEAAKTVQIPNVLVDSQAEHVPVSLTEIPEEGSSIPDPDFFGDSTPLIPDIPEDMEPLGECVLQPKKKVFSIAQLGVGVEELPDDDIEDLGRVEEGREERISVGAGRVVTRRSRKYRAR